MSVLAEKVTKFELDKENELRFEVEAGNIVELELVKGMAEIKGVELVKHKRYQFSAYSKIPVFTYQGCQIDITGNLETGYVSKETPMIMYSNTHLALEQLRQRAEHAEPNPERGPRVLIVGPTDVGKSTVCQIFINYAVRNGRSPIYTDLDVGQGHISLPGSLGAVTVERLLDVEEGFSSISPLILHFGHVSPRENPLLYNSLISRLAELINAKCLNSPKASASGIIINSCGWVREEGYHALIHAATSFQVDLIIVIDQDRLHSQLLEDIPSFVKIVLLPKSGGVVERTTKQRQYNRNECISQYFYGTIRSPLTPHAFEVKFEDILLFKIGAPQLPDSCLPLGMGGDSNRTKIVALQPAPTLLHRVCSVSSASQQDEILNSNILGFIIITSVNMAQNSFTILSPAPYPLPKNILLVSEIVFMDVK